MAYVDRNGLMVPADYLERQNRPVYQELAVSPGDGKDITKGYFTGLELEDFEDPILVDRLGRDLARYETIMGDDQVKSCMEQRIKAVTQAETEVEPGGTSAADKAAAKWMEEALDVIQWDHVTGMMLLNEVYGYGVAELMLRPDGSHVMLDSIKVRRARRFRWGTDGSLRLLTMADQVKGEIMPPRKFWTYASGADNSDSPYGKGLGHWLYWPTYFKRNGLKFWLVFLEKFGMPTVKVELPKGMAEDRNERKKALEVIRAIQADSGIAVPEGFLVELIEAARAGTAGYEALYDRMNRAISKVLLSQTMTTDDGSSLSQAKVHEGVGDDIKRALADMICESFNRGPATWLTEWNFPGAKPPRVWRRVEDEPDLKPQAERDKIIVDMGFEPTEQYINDTYGGDWKKKQPLPLGGPGLPPPGLPGPNKPPMGLPPPGFSELPLWMTEAIEQRRQDQRDLADAAAVLASNYREVIGPRYDQLVAQLNESGNLNEFMERLDEMLYEPPPVATVEKAQRAGLFARLMGRLATQKGRQ